MSYNQQSPFVGASQYMQEQPQQPQQSTSEGGYPTSMYCLKCRQNRPVTNVQLTETAFKSKAKGTMMKRSTYQGKCNSCGTVVRRFASANKKS